MRYGNVDMDLKKIAGVCDIFTLDRLIIKCNPRPDLEGGFITKEYERDMINSDICSVVGIKTGQVYYLFADSYCYKRLLLFINMDPSLSLRYRFRDIIVMGINDYQVGKLFA